jgi:hypothetical protein
MLHSHEDAILNRFIKVILHTDQVYGHFILAQFYLRCKDEKITFTLLEDVNSNFIDQSHTCDAGRTTACHNNSLLFMKPKYYKI